MTYSAGYQTTESCSKKTQRSGILQATRRRIESLVDVRCFGLSHRVEQSRHLRHGINVFLCDVQAAARRWVMLTPRVYGLELGAMLLWQGLSDGLCTAVLIGNIPVDINYVYGILVQSLGLNYDASN